MENTGPMIVFLYVDIERILSKNLLFMFMSIKLFIRTVDPTMVTSNYFPWLQNCRSMIWESVYQRCCLC